MDVDDIVRSRRSPNFYADPGREIKIIVLHATAGSASGALSWLCSRQSGVSAHYLIDKRGTVYQLVADKHVAWHAGVSAWKEYVNLNRWSLGIELENKNDGHDPYPDAQIHALVDLLRLKVCQYRIPRDMIVTHAEVALPHGRKTDPRGLDVQAVLARVFDDTSTGSA